MPYNQEQVNAMRKAATHSRPRGIYFAFSVPTIINGGAHRKESLQTDGPGISPNLFRGSSPWKIAQLLEKFAANCHDLIIQNKAGSKIKGGRLNAVHKF